MIPQESILSPEVLRTCADFIVALIASFAAWLASKTRRIQKQNHEE